MTVTIVPHRKPENSSSPGVHLKNNPVAFSAVMPESPFKLPQRSLRTAFYRLGVAPAHFRHRALPLAIFAGNAARNILETGSGTKKDNRLFLYQERVANADRNFKSAELFKPRSR